jgi:hypothetical protein
VTTNGSIPRVGAALRHHAAEVYSSKPDGGVMKQYPPAPWRTPLAGSSSADWTG